VKRLRDKEQDIREVGPLHTHASNLVTSAVLDTLTEGN
jgi:hypothetical protein